MSAPTPQAYRDIALAAERAGDFEGARRAMAEALGAFPHDPALANSAGNLAIRAGDAAMAEHLFARAAELAPGDLEYALNRSIALFRLGDYRAAIAVLEPHEGPGGSSPRYCSARGAAERAAGNLDRAALWYEACLALDQRHGRGMHGRARVAIERGEDDALERFERALAVNPGDADLWLGKAQALDVTGESAQAREIAEALVAQAPQWLEGLKFLAQLRLAAGEEDWTGHYRVAANRHPDDPSIPSAHATLLDGLDRYAEAAEVAAEARKRFPGEARFALLEAIEAGAAGDDTRAEAIFAQLQLDTSDRAIHEARHRIRQGRPQAAAKLLDRAIAEHPWTIEGWALRGIVWRLLDDPRTDWLHGQAGLATLLPLPGADSVLSEIVPLLHRLHDRSPLPLGQSLRGGTQTRGILFQRVEPELARLHAAIVATLEDYRAQLPGHDDVHPLLRHRESAWKLAGSWSVRLFGGGDHHTAHIHPQGIVSSALYLDVPPPQGDDPQAGWLELGRPPPDLRLELPPLRTIEPRPGHLALFPSTLYHGTRPFPVATRMTVAFDVTPDDGAPR